MSETKVLLEENELPTYWYNIAADLPRSLQPPLNPKTREPLHPEALAPIFPQGLIEQEISQERWIQIPEEVREILRLWRPTPLYRAYRLERHLSTPARIYYKYEGVSPTGSHKPNTAIAQAYYNKVEGVKRLTTETGAGQWGSALSLACHLFGLECQVYMVRISYQQKPYRHTQMKIWGAKVTPSPSLNTCAGREVLERDPDCNGSLGIAIGEAIEDALSHADTKYALGSVLNHVLLHQTVIGLEAQKQLKKAGDIPEVVIGCCGGGSNFAGLAFPFLCDKIHGKELRAIAVEPEACPTLTRGKFTYDFGDAARQTPLLPMYTLGHDFVPPGIHAGGLRYHGMSPLVSQLLLDGLIEARAYEQQACFEASLIFARTEGIISAPEASHAIRAVIDEALRAREEGKERVILFNLSGHGHFDMGAFEAYLKGDLSKEKTDES
ncbi:MAG: TrpB-like pyridoxal-phosphate dependent enzyme [Nitrospinae bacterium RIFCSPLOWO2_12_FULL_45_22]|nr:MAG: TrpB-like pyridoxal-phosphate dependent enzyme [Nitrospinae bacterium RIFCSPLOWO2_12_FULL_45_22]